MSLLREVLDIPPERREVIREAIAALEKVGSKPTVRAVAKIAKGDRNTLALICKAFREGLIDSSRSWGVELDQRHSGQPVPAGDGAADVDALVARIRTAAGPGDLVEVSRLALELAAAGAISEARARVVRDLAQEQRRAMADARQVEPPPEDPTTFLLASAEAMQVARAVDLLVDDERRAALIAHVAAVLQDDLDAEPNVDCGGA